MNIAFYAPMKSPNHPKASGDRLIANNFLHALQLTGEHNIVIASELSTWEGKGCSNTQQQLRVVADKEVAVLLASYADNPSTKPELWFTYHCYHKAPDYIGQQICQALAIPYIIAELSIAHKQAHGPWDMGYQSSLQSLAQSNHVLINNINDLTAIKSLVIDQKLSTNIMKIKPFLAKKTLSFSAESVATTSAKAVLADQFNLNKDKKWLVIVAQMRNGDKMRSYDIALDVLARYFDKYGNSHVQCLIIGDGAGFDSINQRVSVINDHNADKNAYNSAIRVVGAVDNAKVHSILSQAWLLYWPAVNEAIGMVFLEAMAAGVPVLSCARKNQIGGVHSVIYHNQTGIVIDDFNVDDQVEAINDLLLDNAQHQKLATQSCNKYQSEHNLDAAVQQLKMVIANNT